MRKIITITGQKGGTGKSVTAVNLAASLALCEKNTLLIDCDPQACSTKWCKINDENYDCDIAFALSGRKKFTDAIVKTKLKYLDMMLSGFDLFHTGVNLSKTLGNEKILRILLKDVKSDYDYIIIDPPSSYNFLSVAAITAADWLLVCMSLHHDSTEDFHCLLKMVKHIQVSYNVPLKIAGLVFNKCENNKDIQLFLKNHNLPDSSHLFCHTCIPEDENIKKAIDLKIPAALHDIKSPAAAAYLTFAKQIHLFFKQRGVL